MSPPGLRLLLYAWRISLGRAAGALGLLVGAYLIVDTVESASFAQIPLVKAAVLWPWKLPLVLAHVGPVAAALAAVLAFGALLRRGEWVAVAAAGVSPRLLIGGIYLLPCCSAALAVPLVHELAPRCVARYEAGVSREAGDGEKGPPSPRWIRDGIRIVRRAGEPAGPGAVAIERDAAGRAVSWEGPCGEGRRCAWKRGEGWRSVEGLHREMTPGGAVAREPRPGVFGLVGASLTSEELRALVHGLEVEGRVAFPLRAELALRNAIALSCAVVPAFALLLAFVAGTDRSARLALIAVAAAAAYWIALSAAWNGVQRGALSPNWVAWGVPSGFALATAVIAGAASARVTLRR